jgi:hypothetical protein
MTRWKISVYKNLCIGSAMCAAIAHGRFVWISGSGPGRPRSRRRLIGTN